MVLSMVQPILGYINFSDPTPLNYARSGRLSVWMKKRNTINNVIYTVLLEDKFQLTNVIRRGFRSDIADFNKTVVHVCNTFISRCAAVLLQAG